MLGIFLVAIVVFFFILVSIAFLLGWHSYREKNMLGGLVVLWVVLILFVLAVILGTRARQATNQNETGLAPPVNTSTQ